MTFAVPPPRAPTPTAFLFVTPSLLVSFPSLISGGLCHCPGPADLPAYQSSTFSGSGHRIIATSEANLCNPIRWCPESRIWGSRFSQHKVSSLKKRGTTQSRQLESPPHQPEVGAVSHGDE
ncbi:hypothetical protein NDU88_003290 [Pleurodeles waltl]|uniref:Secreted protein n=1 Tax=Pleurodeles waltl TaxID=8319 RepID=A0AAV7UDM6_PLEWA|nr:hypothetical protein NDU88_003290 [Pleurodeles waltl]